MNIIKFIKELSIRCKKNNIPAHSAQLAYFFTLSLFPFLIFLFAVLGKLSLAITDFESYINTFVPAEPAKIITSYIQNLLGVRNDGVLSISILFSLWVASRGFHALKESLNNTYGVKETRNFIHMRLIGMVYTVFLTVSIIFALVLPSIGMKFFTFIGTYIDLSLINVEMIQWLKWIFTIVFLVLIVSLIYLFMPNVKLKYKDVLPGATFAVTGWLALSLGFSYFINNFSNYSIVYGSLATIIIFMIWLYLVGNILMIGGEINCLMSMSNKKMTDC